MLDWANHGEPAPTAAAPAHDPAPAAPHGETQAPVHGDSAAGHGDAHGATSGAHATDSHATKTDDHGHAPPHAAAPTAKKGDKVTWNDPIVLVGISGVLSLLVAAVLAMKK